MLWKKERSRLGCKFQETIQGKNSPRVIFHAIFPEDLRAVELSIFLCKTSDGYVVFEKLGTIIFKVYEDEEFLFL